MKLSKTKITRVVAGVTLVTATTMGCSENATNSRTITEGFSHTPSVMNAGGEITISITEKTILTMPNFFVFLNEYSNNPSVMRDILLEFEVNFHQASFKYFYLTEELSSQISILQTNYNFFTPLVRDIRNNVELAIQKGSQSLRLEYIPIEGDENEDFDWDNPPAAAPSVEVSVGPYIEDNEIGGSLTVTGFFSSLFDC